MADETFGPRKHVQNPEDEANQEMAILNRAEQIRQNFENSPGSTDPDSPIKITGTPPKAFLEAARARQQGGQLPTPNAGFGRSAVKEEIPAMDRKVTSNRGGSDKLKGLIDGLKPGHGGPVYDTIQLPSKGRFYNGTDGPTDGVLTLRPMTGDEEQILATPRFVKRGQAVNMIFSRCMGESYKPELFLTIDRTYLLIYLRIISYSNLYDVNVRCSDCEKKFDTTIDLNTACNIEACPDTFGPVLEGVLPSSGYHFSYRLSTGRDEIEIQEYRDRRVKAFGDAVVDDTLIYRSASLINEIEGLDDKQELQALIRSLPISDVSYLRQCVNEPPFGVDTNVEIVCSHCLQDFNIDLPLESNFFFPRRKKMA